MSLFIIITGLVLLIAVPVLIGMMVYKDAKNRGLEPWFWALASMLVPYFIGLIIYLVARSNRKRLRCARCGQTVEAGYNVCPQCGEPLQYTCQACGMPVQPQWNVCAKCGAAQPQGRTALVTNATAEDDPGKRIWIMIGCAVGAVVLLALVGISAFAIVGAI
ncbi:MAG: zinc ribbon domain-containing protein [Christensenellaceae bacterium]|nr:zinc ribbon domain-containing protein [Christensenellaceae bacterium]